MAFITSSPSEAVDYYLSTCDYSDSFGKIKKWLNSGISNPAKAWILVYGPHQYRIPNVNKEILVEKLDRAMPWADSFPDFESIYLKIKNILVPFQGRVTLYDISFRLGLSINVYPGKYVYITSGNVIENAKIILGLSKDPGIKRKKTDFPLWLQVLETWQIEDFLCHVIITGTPSELNFEFKEKNQKPFSKYPDEVKKELETLQ